MLISQATSVCLALRGANEYASSCYGTIVLSTTFWTASPTYDVSGLGSTGVVRLSDSTSRRRNEPADADPPALQDSEISGRAGSVGGVEPIVARERRRRRTRGSRARGARAQPALSLRRLTRECWWRRLGHGWERPMSLGGSEALTALTSPRAERMGAAPCRGTALAVAPSGHHVRNIEDEKGARQMRVWRHSRPNLGRRVANTICVRAGPATPMLPMRKSDGEAG